MAVIISITQSVLYVIGDLEHKSDNSGSRNGRSNLLIEETKEYHIYDYTLTDSGSRNTDISVQKTAIKIYTLHKYST